MTAAEWLIAIVVLYPVMTAALWVAGASCSGWSTSAGRCSTVTVTGPA
jgi:hypothetical protein